MAIAAAALVITGCGMQIPADPDGTLERVRGDTLRVGVSEHAPWVELGAEGTPSGTEPALLTEFAEQLDAEIAWTAGSEAALVVALERGDLDVVVGGFLDSTPWVERAAVTRPYTETQSADGTASHVMLTPLGENAFLSELERFLDAEGEA